MVEVDLVEGGRGCDGADGGLPVRADCSSSVRFVC